MLVFNGNRISVWRDVRVPEMDSGDGRIARWMYFMALNYALENG